MACANRRVALAAKQGLTSPFYYSVVTAMPTSKLYSPAGLQRLFPYHSWDFDAASRTAWETNTKAIGAGKHQEPTPADLEFGRMLLDHWVHFMYHGVLNSSFWRPVQDAPVNMSWGSRVDLTTVTPVLDFKADICKFWESIGVGHQWWWVN
eukprot:5477793-Amphidinium_carterae.1